MFIVMRARTSCGSFLQQAGIWATQPRRQRHDFCRHPASYGAGLVSVELHTYQTLAMLKKERPLANSAGCCDERQSTCKIRTSVQMISVSLKRTHSYLYIYIRIYLCIYTYMYECVSNRRHLRGVSTHNVQRTCQTNVI
jgi:hypothetical protein